MRIIESTTNKDKLGPGKKGFLRDASGNPVCVVLPPKIDEGDTAMLTLHVPASHAWGALDPGIRFSMQLETFHGELLPISQGAVIYESDRPRSKGRIPLTLTSSYPLSTVEVRIYAHWESLRGSMAVIDSMGDLTLSAMLDDKYKE